MHKVILSILFCVSICVCSQANSKLYISDCGDDSYLLHYKHVEASEFIRGKDVFINSEKVLLSANITSGTVTFDCLRNDMSVFKHDFDYCGYQEASLPLGLGKIKYTGSDCSQPRPFEDSFHMSVRMPMVTPGGKYEFTLRGVSSDGDKLYCFYAYTKL